MTGFESLLERTPAGHSPITFLMSELSSSERQRMLDSFTPLESSIFEHSWGLWARHEQRPPQAWLDKTKHTWVILGGRGMGKTRPGSETTIEQAEEIGRHYRHGSIALIAKDPADARKVMLEGESGILRVSPPWFRPHWEPSKTQLTWPNGVVANIFSTEQPDDLRGPQHHFGWWDEPGKAKHPQETWDMYQFGLRLGEDPRTVLTGTPRPTKTLKSILADLDTCVTRGTTLANAANLAPSFLRYILRKYQGTRLGRQELDAEMLDDTPGALWTLTMIEQHRVEKAPKLKKIVVAIDPQGAHPDDQEEDDETAETGIVACGLGVDDDLYVLADRSEKLSPDDWGTRAVEVAYEFAAEEIVGEVNNGGAMVEFVVRTAADKVRKLRKGSTAHAFVKVTASRGKRTRGEPISALYEQGRGHHVGAFPELEDQMSTWIPGMKSPDRMDALVWAATRLMFPDGDVPLDHDAAGMASAVTW